MAQLFIMYVRGEFDSIYEDATSCRLSGEWLDHVQAPYSLVSIIAPTLDMCWMIADQQHNVIDLWANKQI